MSKRQQLIASTKAATEAIAHLNRTIGLISDAGYSREYTILDDLHVAEEKIRNSRILMMKELAKLKIGETHE